MGIKKIKRKAQAEMILLREEYEQIIKFTMKEKPGSLLEGLSLGSIDLKDLYEERKPRKYAALVIELYAIVEQSLKDIYKNQFNKEYQKEFLNKKNIIHDLEIKLSDVLSIPKRGSLKTLSDLRNYIVHQEFSLKSARQSLEIKEKNRELFDSLITNAEDYIQSLAIIEAN